MRPTALIVRTAGTNCDRELAHAFTLAGADPRTVHLNALLEDPGLLESAAIVGFPGGFSYGDDIAAGRILANRLRHRLLDPLRAAIARKVPMIGICNGFQVLLKMGLLPDPAAASPQGRGGQVATLTDNDSGRFIDRWVQLDVPPQTVCLWVRPLARATGAPGLALPIAHGEGRFVPESDQVLEQLRSQGQIALRYACTEGNQNPNGSVDAIAGICDPSGLVLGLMPHPERFTDWTNHPLWTRLGPTARSGPPAGLAMFQHAVEHVRTRAGVHPGVD